MTYLNQRVGIHILVATDFFHEAIYIRIGQMDMMCLDIYSIFPDIRN